MPGLERAAWEWRACVSTRSSTGPTGKIRTIGTTAGSGISSAIPRADWSGSSLPNMPTTCGGHRRGSGENCCPRLPADRPTRARLRSVVGPGRGRAAPTALTTTSRMIALMPSRCVPRRAPGHRARSRCVCGRRQHHGCERPSCLLRCSPGDGLAEPLLAPGTRPGRGRWACRRQRRHAHYQRHPLSGTPRNDTTAAGRRRPCLAVPSVTAGSRPRASPAASRLVPGAWLRAARSASR